MGRQRIGHILDELDVQLDIGSNQRVTQAFIIGKVMDLDTGASYLVLGSNGMDWIEEGGLLSAANEARRATIQEMLMHTGACDDPNCEEHKGDG
jgi:hypothetical protein